jgi:chaperonin cofactor prefoldin
MKSSNFKIYYKDSIIIISKILLFLYILFATNIENKIILSIINDNGIKLLLLLLIIYLISIDYTLSILVLISLIISILIYNKKDIDNLKNRKKELNKKIHKIKIANVEKKNENTTEDLEDIDENINNAIVSLENNIDGFAIKLDSIQNNIFNMQNNNLYVSGDYNTSISTSQGILN